MPDISPRELATLLPLAAIVLVLGVYPHAILDLIDPTLVALNETVAGAAGLAIH